MWLSNHLSLDIKDASVGCEGIFACANTDWYLADVGPGVEFNVQCKDDKSCQHLNVYLPVLSVDYFPSLSIKCSCDSDSDSNSSIEACRGAYILSCEGTVGNDSMRCPIREPLWQLDVRVCQPGVDCEVMCALVWSSLRIHG